MTQKQTGNPQPNQTAHQGSQRSDAQGQQGSKSHNTVEKSPGSGDHKGTDQHAKVEPGGNTQTGQQKTDSAKKNQSGSSQQK